MLLKIFFQEPILRVYLFLPFVAVKSDWGSNNRHDIYMLFLVVSMVCWSSFNVFSTFVEILNRERFCCVSSVTRSRSCCGSVKNRSRSSCRNQSQKKKIAINTRFIVPQRIMWMIRQKATIHSFRKATSASNMSSISWSLASFSLERKF